MFISSDARIACIWRKYIEICCKVGICEQAE